MNKEIVVYKHNGTPHSYKKLWNPSVCHTVLKLEEVLLNQMSQDKLLSLIQIYNARNKTIYIESKPLDSKDRLGLAKKKAGRKE